MYLLLYVLFFFTHINFPASGQAVVTSVVPSPPGSCLQFLSRIALSNPTARRFFIEYIPGTRYSLQGFSRVRGFQNVAGRVGLGRSLCFKISRVGSGRDKTL